MTTNDYTTQPLKLRVSRWLTLAGIAGLVVVMVFSRDGTLATALLQCAPLAIVMPGLLLQWYRTYSWLSLMILLYFIVAVTRAMAPDGNWADNLLVALTVTIFWASAFGSRWLQHYIFQSNNQPNCQQAEHQSTELEQNKLSKETP